MLLSTDARALVLLSGLIGFSPHCGEQAGVADFGGGRNFAEHAQANDCSCVRTIGFEIVEQGVAESIVS